MWRLAGANLWLASGVVKRVEGVGKCPTSMFFLARSMPSCPWIYEITANVCSYKLECINIAIYFWISYYMLLHIYSRHTNKLTTVIWPHLVGGLEHEFYFSIYWGMSSSQLTFIYFRGVGLNHQPVILKVNWSPIADGLPLRIGAAGAAEERRKVGWPFISSDLVAAIYHVCTLSYNHVINQLIIFCHNINIFYIYI